MMGITGAFSSLCINERPRPLPGIRKFSKNRSTVSLPNMDFSERPQFIKTVCDDEVEQPVDFSKKYCETKSIQIDKEIIDNGRTFNTVVKNYNNSFTIYAETDLDQPTDYSLRYAEDDSDSDRCNKITKTEPAEFVQDTVKTYCTEDTPYETPFNFSTATSMSDLRLDEKPPDKLDVPIHENGAAAAAKEIPRDKIKSEFSSGLMSPEKPVSYCEEGTPGYFSRVPSCGSLNSIPVTESSKQEIVKKELRRAETKVVKFEEVVNYAEETPLMFSRSSSLGSLGSIEQHSIHDDRSSVVSDVSRLTSGVISPSELPDSPSQTVPPSPRPRKTKSFPLPPKKKVENLPKPSIFEDSVKKFKLESTPLHFSTATSLSSLVDDEVDSKVPNNDLQVENGNNENLNDHLSEEDEELLAACINMGMQGHRYNPPKSKSPVEKPPSYIAMTLPVITFKGPENGPFLKSDVTSDSVRTYCTEGTPAGLSHAGSNSDLSILSMHLNEKLTGGDLEDEREELLESEVGNGENRHEADSLDGENQNGDSKARRSSISSLSESEEALLEKCILDGMAKSPSPASSSAVVPTDEKVTLDVKNLKEVTQLNSSEENELILEDCIKKGIENNRFIQPKLNSSKLHPSDYKKRQNLPLLKSPPNEIADDVVKSFCTEDTPAILSHAGSCSNLSILSLQGSDSRMNNDYFSDDAVLTDEEEKLLEQCIKLGMGVVDEKERTNNKHRKRVKGRKSREKCGNAAPPPYDAASLSDDDEALLQRCIEAGMPRRRPQTAAKPSHDLDSDEEALLQQCIEAGMSNHRPLKTSTTAASTDLDSEEEALLQKCIEAGMNGHAPKNNADQSSDLSSGEEELLQECIQAGMAGMASKPRPREESSDLSSGEEELLQRCIQAGMAKATPRIAKNQSSALTPTQKAVLQQCILDGMRKCKTVSRKEEGSRRAIGRSRSGRDAAELSESERLLLQQCILAGLPKSRRSKGRSKEAEHTCCVHCPRNRAGRQKGRRKHKERVQSRDVSVVYVASQILTVRKEVVDRTREKWV